MGGTVRDEKKWKRMMSKTQTREIERNERMEHRRNIRMEREGNGNKVKRMRRKRTGKDGGSRKRRELEDRR